jgi:signal peptidase I
VEAALLAAFAVALLSAAAVTALKGKWGVLALGLLCWPAWALGAVRLARPGSYWARRFYDAEQEERATREASFRRRLAMVGAVVAVLVVAALLGLFKTYRIVSSAMAPTLRCGGSGAGCTAESSDRILARRYLFRKEPGRGDLVVFRTPERARIECGAGGVYAKRVVALPGERWAMQKGIVYIDGEPLDEGYVPQARRDSDTRPPQRVPDAAYLVLGDNRAQSCDSRVWGPVPRKQLIGKVVLRYWPLSRLGLP